MANDKNGAVINLDEYRAKLAPVKDLDGQAVQDDETSYLIPVDFTVTERKRQYQVLVNTAGISVLDYFTWQHSHNQLAKQNASREASELIGEALKPFTAQTGDGASDPVDAIEDRPTRRALLALRKLAGLVPAIEQPDENLSREDFLSNVTLMMKGALVWNVPDIELTEEGLLNGDINVVMAATGAMMEAIRPTSGSSETKPNETSEKKDDSSSSTTLPLMETVDTSSPGS